MYGDSIQTAIHFAMDKEFGPTIKAQMLHYNGPNADQMSEVNQKMDDVKNVMVQNIEMVCIVPGTAGHSMTHPKQFQA